MLISISTNNCKVKFYNSITSKIVHVMNMSIPVMTSIVLIIVVDMIPMIAIGSIIVVDISLFILIVMAQLEPT